jgi:hypothetical protein
MALARVNRHQQTSTTAFGAGPFTTTGFTPASSSLLVARIGAVSNSNDAMQGSDLAISDSVGLTWTPRIASTTHPGWGYGERIWTAPIVTGALMTLTADAGTFNIHDYRVEVYEYTGHDVASPVGATAVGSDADGQGAAQIILSAPPALTSQVLAFCQTLVGSGSGSVTPGNSPWAELFDVPVSGWTCWQSQVRTGSASTAVDWVNILATGGAGGGAVLTALEIKEAGGGGGTSILRQMMNYHGG